MINLAQILSKISTPVTLKRNPENNLLLMPNKNVTENENEGYLILFGKEDPLAEGYLYLKPADYAEYAKPSKNFHEAKISKKSWFFHDPEVLTWNSYLRIDPTSSITFNQYHKLLEKITENPEKYAQGIPNLRKIDTLLELFYNRSLLLKKINGEEENEYKEGQDSKTTPAFSSRY